METAGPPSTNGTGLPSFPMAHSRMIPTCASNAARGDSKRCRTTFDVADGKAHDIGRMAGDGGGKPAAARGRTPDPGA
jgi:hypothetical protein